MGALGSLACNADPQAPPPEGQTAEDPAKPADAGVGPGTLSTCDGTSPGELYAQRIAPLLNEDRPNSCSTCHLAGVDLGAFVRDDPCEAMACLREKGLADLNNPADSLILSWIARAEPDSPLITDTIIDEEYQGFLEWIEWSAQCGTQQCGDAHCTDTDALACPVAPGPSDEELDAGARPQVPCDAKALERFFQETIFFARGRCSPCHVDSYEKDLVGDPPRWLSTRGNCDQASLASLRAIEHFGLIDFKQPAQSLLLLKPLAVFEGGLIHGGDDKFHSKQDPAYLSFLAFIERYAECRNAE